MSDAGEITAHEVDALYEQLLSDGQRSGIASTGTWASSGIWSKA